MTTQSKTGTHMVDLLFTLALFCVFAASALMVVLIGANVYQNTVEGMDENFSARTSVTYVATKIRQNDTEGTAYISTLEGDIPALVLEQELEGGVYETWIYYCDGFLRESFVREGNAVNPQGGQEILEVADFHIGRAGNSFALAATDHNGNTTELVVTPRCGIAGTGEVAP